MESPTLQLNQELKKLRQSELIKEQQKILEQKNKDAARSVLLSISILLDSSKPLPK